MAEKHPPAPQTRNLLLVVETVQRATVPFWRNPEKAEDFVEFLIPF